MKSLIITILLATLLIAVALYCVTVFVVIEYNPLNWHAYIRLIYVILLSIGVYKVFKRLTNEDKGSVQ